MAYVAGEYLVTGTATSIASALSLSGAGRLHYLQVILRNNPGAANSAFVGESDVTTTANRGAVLAATDSAPLVLSGEGGHALDVSKIYLIGTAGAANIIFITLIQ